MEDYVLRNSRRQIALLLGQPEEYHQKLFTQGFLREAFRLDCDVYIFCMFIKYQNTPEREKGDSSIFKLPDYSKFDAVVIMADTIQTPGLVKKIEEDLHDNFKGQVLFVDRESEYFESVAIDNYNPIKKVINHLIKDHGLTDIAFLTGKSWHPHAIERMRAYKEAMQENGLEVREDRCFTGDFWYTSGESLAERLISSGKKLPEAIACANDCMAIGVAKTFCNAGYNIPDDIVIVGYDTTDEGRHSPVPLTSAFLPSEDLGAFSADAINRMIDGEAPGKFTSDSKMFIGESCGCEEKDTVPVYVKRDRWDTDTSEAGAFSLFNHLDEDIIGQTSFTGLISTIFSHVYLMRDSGFSEFSLNINEDWEKVPKRQDIYQGSFSEKIREVLISGGAANSERMSFDTVFDRNELICPHEDRLDIPTGYFFMPIYFDDRVYGYSVAGTTDWHIGIDGPYRAFLRSIMKGFEYFRRNDFLVSSSQLFESNFAVDRLTGLGNYQGFRNHLPTILNICVNNGGYIGILAVDIKDLSRINEKYGRDEGDYAIITVASLLDRVFDTNGCFIYCIGNGELIAIQVSSQGDLLDIKKAQDRFLKLLADHNHNSGKEYSIDVYYGYAGNEPGDISDIESLANQAISIKNGNKTKAQKLAADTKLSEDEQKEAGKVNDILDENRITYHFQPIVRAKDGSIYGYEALMRAEATPYIPPLQVLRFAEFFNRLYDVEKSTFTNVMKIVSERKDIFDGTKKVFINSIPSNRIKAEDINALFNNSDIPDDTIVAELTEQTEITDEELSSFKSDLTSHDVKLALDDYGTGYSNVTNLLRYMPNYVKIDRMLLQDIQESPQKQHFVKEIITFAHDNNIFALAEGVETYDELSTVIKLGADLIQGYYTARPSQEIVSEIDKKIIDEIIKINQEIADGIISDDNGNTGVSSVYVAGRDDKVVLSKLVASGISTVEIGNPKATYIDQTLVGTPGVTAPLSIIINNSFKGRITLSYVDLGRNIPNPFPIIVESGCDVTFVINGNNVIKGGIKVEEGAKATIEGDGTLEFTGENEEYTAIGNNFASGHGDIIIDCTGLISVDFNGKKCIGIGSGKGGSIKIKRGKLKFSMSGHHALVIGSVRGNGIAEIVNASIEADVKAREMVFIGSVISNHTLTLIRNSVLKANLNGKDICGIGSLGDGKAVVALDNVDMTAAVEGHKTVFIGNASETAEIKITDSFFRGRVSCNEGGFISGNRDDMVDINNSFSLIYNGKDLSLDGQ